MKERERERDLGKVDGEYDINLVRVNSRKRILIDVLGQRKYVERSLSMI